MKNKNNNYLDNFSDLSPSPLWWKIFVIVVVTILTLSLAVVCGYFAAAKSVPLGSYGVRMGKLPPFKGKIQILSPGLHYEIPFFTETTLVSKKVKTLSLHIPVETEEQLFGTMELKVVFQYQDNTSDGILRLMDDFSSDVDMWPNFVRNEVTRLFEERTENAIYVSPEDYRRLIAEITASARQRLQRYGIELWGIYLVESPNELELIHRLKIHNTITQARQKYRLLEASLKAEKEKAEGTIEQLRFETSKVRDALINDAELYRIKKESESNALLLQAVADVEKEKQLILSVLNKEQREEVKKKIQGISKEVTIESSVKEDVQLQGGE